MSHVITLNKYPDCVTIKVGDLSIDVVGARHESDWGCEEVELCVNAKSNIICNLRFPTSIPNKQ